MDELANHLRSRFTLKQAALVAGFAYLFSPVSLAEAYLMPHLVNADPGQTVANLQAHPGMLSAAILCYLISAVCDVVTAWALYTLLAPVSRAGALLQAALQWVYAAGWLSSMQSLVTVHRLMTHPELQALFGPAGVRAHVALALLTYRAQWSLTLLLFGLHLVVLGWLMARSTYLPRWLGWLLLVDGCAWLLDGLSVYLFPHARLPWLNLLFGAELVFMVWLLGWGWRLRDVVVWNGELDGSAPQSAR